MAARTKRKATTPDSGQSPTAPLEGASKPLPARKAHTAGIDAPTREVSEETARPTITWVDAPHGKYKRYTDRDRAWGVLVLGINGYPDTPGALALTARQTGIMETNLLNWYTGNKAPIPSEETAELKADITSILDTVIRLNLARASDPDAVAKTSAAQAMTVAAIAIDKQRLINGLPTEIVSVLPDFMGALRMLGTDVVMLMQRTIERAEQEAGYKRLNSG